MNRPSPSPDFPILAAMFEAGLIAVAMGLGWLLGRPPLATFEANPVANAFIPLAVLPPAILLLVCVWWPTRLVADVLRIVDEMIVPLFRGCRVLELAVISLLAGLGEEMLFRGVLQAAAADWFRALVPGQDAWLGGRPADWLAAGAVAVLFGLAHAVNRSYAVLAGLIGLYLGWLWMATGELMVPIAVHALYDFLALVYLVRIRGRGRS